MGDLRLRAGFPVAAVPACGSLSASYMGSDPVQFGALAVVGGPTSFESGHRYSLDASHFGPEGTSAPRISFTPDDFARIGDGQVLASRDRDRSHVVSRDSFVKDACGRKGPGA